VNTSVLPAARKPARSASSCDREKIFSVIRRKSITLGLPWGTAGKTVKGQSSSVANGFHTSKDGIKPEDGDKVPFAE
jgi:hypothetical protein